MGRRYLFDERHGVQVSRLAMSLFDQLRRVHGMDSGDRRLLRAAAVLHIGNLALSYDRGGFSGLLSVNYQGDYYQQIGATRMEDRLLHRRRQIDLAANQQLSPNVRAFVQLNNLNNEPYMRYFGNVNFPDENEFEGRWGTLGLRFNF